jgi:release factor glutamine methyltransferase
MPSSPTNLQHHLSTAATRLATTLALDATTARIEAQSLLQHILNVPRAWLLAHGDDILTADQFSACEKLLQRRLHGEPLAYLLGEREFFGLPFKVTPATLIPRPETELLVELALERIAYQQPHPHPNPPLEGEGSCPSPLAPVPSPSRGGLGWGWGNTNTPTILDLGTGSGAIALSIAHARSHSCVLACDASAAALTIARENADRLQLTNVTFLQSDWYAALNNQRCHLIVSNPPYIAANDPHLQQGDLRFEPPSALASGDDGLRDIRLIVAQARDHLEPDGWLLLEHGYDQAQAVRTLLHKAGFTEIFSAHDLAGIERCTGGQWRVNIIRPHI